MSNDDSGDKKSIFREIFLDVVVKFAVEIVGAILIAAFWYFFQDLKSWVYGPEPSTDNGSTVISQDVRENVISQKTDKPKRPAMNDAEFVELCRVGDVVKVEEAIQNGAYVNARNNNGWTALMMAALNGHTETARVFLQNNADVNARDNNGLTALRWTKMRPELKGHQDTVNLLLSYGAKY